MFTWRNLAAVIVAAHGIGFSLWFMASWMGTKIGPGSDWLFSDLSITSAVGKLFGLLAVAVIMGFLATAFGIFTNAGWWPLVGLTTAITAMVVVIPWWNVVTPTNAMGAFLVNAAVIVSALGSGAAQQIVQRASV